MSATTKSLSLTGHWYGSYSYDGVMEPTAFTATLVDVEGWISGATEEQVDHGEGMARTFPAMVAGTRTGSAVEFDKTYDGTGGLSHTVRYVGALTADGTEIEGRWRLPDGHSGPFLMMRAGGQEVGMEHRVHAKV